MHHGVPIKLHTEMLKNKTRKTNKKWMNKDELSWRPPKYSDV